MGTLLGGCAGKPDRKEATVEERARLFVDAASAAMIEGDLIGALQYLKTAEALDSDLPEIYHTRAMVFHAKKDMPAAIREVKRAVALRPGDVNANNTYGKLLIDSGNYSEAEKPLLKATLDPTWRETYKALTNLGILHYRLDHPSKALAWFDKAVLEAPATACIAWYYKGHLALKENNFKDATRNYDNATQKFCAGFADAHLALGIAFERSKQYDHARKKFLDVKQNFPNTKTAEQAMDRLTYLP